MKRLVAMIAFSLGMCSIQAAAADIAFVVEAYDATETTVILVYDDGRVYRSTLRKEQRERVRMPRSCSNGRPQVHLSILTTFDYETIRQGQPLKQIEVSELLHKRHVVSDEGDWKYSLVSTPALGQGETCYYAATQQEDPQYLKLRLIGSESGFLSAQPAEPDRVQLIEWLRDVRLELPDARYGFGRAQSAAEEARVNESGDQ